MRKITKSKYYLLLTITFLLVIASCVSVNLISQNETVSSNECCDFSSHCEHSHTHCLGDDAITKETVAKQYKLEIQIGLSLSANPNFKDSFNSPILQPPKNS